MGIFSLLLALTLIMTGCELPGEPGGGGADLVILLPGAPGGPDRAITDPGSIGHDAVQRLLTYEITLSRPGSQSVTKAAPYSQSIRFDQLEPGEWTVTTNAFFRGHGNLQANDPNSTHPDARPKTVTLTAGRTESVPVTLELSQELDGLVLIPDAETFKRIGEPAPGGWYEQEKTFLLLTDLTLNEWAGPKIHGDTSAFPQGRVIFNGGGHTIRINSFAAGTGNYGLFTSGNWVDIIGLNIDLNVIATPPNMEFAGGLVTSGIDVDIEDVHVSGILHLSSAYSGSSYAGGIVGALIGGNIALCSSTLDLELENSIGDSIAGGIAGEVDGVSILDSFSSGTIGGETAGGIVGQAVSGYSTSGTVIKHCYSSGTVKGDWNAGGIAGYFEGPSGGSIIGGCYATGTISLSSGSTGNAGGIGGYIDTNGGIDGCLVLAPTVNGPTGSYVGRIAGSASGSLNNNSAIGGTFTHSITPGTTSTDGATISSLSNPPIASDFPNLEVDVYPGQGFAMPPPGWGYPYPVLSWQIDKGIRP